jgi:hypothetical protein
MRVTYAVTFEFETRLPLTHRGIVAGSSGATCVARATREAQRALRPVSWTSMNCVLLERLDGGDGPEVALPAEALGRPTLCGAPA